MPKGVRIGSEIRKRVHDKWKDREKASQIARDLGISLKSVYRILREPAMPSHPPKRGHPKRFTGTLERRIVRSAKMHRSFGVRWISRNLGGLVSATSCWRILRNNMMQRRSMPRRHALTRQERKTRRTFAQQLLHRPYDFGRIIWTDEKLFSLDGPDGFAKVWWEKGRPADRNRSKIDSFGKRGVMVHIAFSRAGILAHTRLSGYLDGPGYKRLLSREVLPAARAAHRSNFILQQDNAPPHTAKIVREYLASKKIELLDWPPYSPDLNPAENLWAIISHELYADNSIYSSEARLWAGINGVVRRIPFETCKNLADSVPARLAKLLASKGGYIK